MSDVSLLTGVYADVETYGALIDNVIERLGRGDVDPDEPDQKKLAQLLVDSADQGLQAQSLEALTLDSLLRTSAGKPLADLKPLGIKLQSRDVDEECLKQLEKLALALEQERTAIARRLRNR